MYAEQLVCLQNLTLDMNREFCVLSKSDSVLDSEIEDIKNTMCKFVLWTTNKQICHEKNSNYFYFFYLSTGRYCISKLYCLENLFYDLTKSNCNYVLEAIIFNSDEETNIIKFLSNGNNKILYQDWEKNGAPDLLPKLEVSKERDLKNYSILNIQHIKKILKLILHCYDLKINTFENISAIDLYCLFKMINSCLPKKIMKDLVLGVATNSNSETLNLPKYVYSNLIFKNKNKRKNDKNNSAKNGNSNTTKLDKDIFETLITICYNQSNSFFKPINTYNFSETIEEYIEYITEKLVKGAKDTFNISSNIDKISNKFNLELNDALNVYKVINNELEKISNILELTNIIEFVEEYGALKCEKVADSLYEYMSNTGEWKKINVKTKLYKFVKKYSKVMPLSIKEFHKKIIDINNELEMYPLDVFKKTEIINDINEKRFFNVYLCDEFIDKCLYDILKLYLLLVDEDNYLQLSSMLVCELNIWDNFEDEFILSLEKMSKEERGLIIGYVLIASYDVCSWRNDYMLVIIKNVYDRRYDLCDTVKKYVPEKYQDKTSFVISALRGGWLDDRIYDF